MYQKLKAFGSYWLIRALMSSIGKKLVMAVTGLALCGFLAVHLGGNLLLYVGSRQYDAYAHALHAQTILLPIAETGLLVLFVGHLALAIATKLENDAARTEGYEVKRTKMDEPAMAKPASSVMYGTGIIVLLFLILHLMDFKIEARHREELQGLAPAAKAAFLLADPLSAAVYIVGSIALGYHVLHGFQSAFQSLGINHPKYTPIIRTLGLVFAITVAVGFGSFPLWALAIQ